MSNPSRYRDRYPPSTAPGRSRRPGPRAYPGTGYLNGPPNTGYLNGPPQNGHSQRHPANAGYSGYSVPPFDERPTVLVEYAGWWARFWAYVTDLVIESVVLVLIVVCRNLILFALQNQGNTVFDLAFTIFADLQMLAFILWYFAGQWAERGQTIGQSMLHIMVVRPDGELISFGRGLLRWLIGMGILDSIVVGLPIGWLWAAWDPQKQAWHDKLAGTIVIRV